MFENLRFAVEVIKNAVGKRSVLALLHQQVFYKRVAVPILVDLSKMEVFKNPFPDQDYRFIELKRDALESGSLRFLLDIRRLDALRNIKRGLRGFALVNADGVVIGDIWCQSPNDKRTPVDHPDLKMLKITCTERDVYALDMFIPSDYRGKKLAVPLHRSMQFALRQEGWQKLYAYYWDDNLASKWTHWMLKCAELPKIQVSRFFFLKKTHPVVQPRAQTPKGYQH